MRIPVLAPLAIALLLVPTALGAAQAQPFKPLDDFERNSDDWKFVGGEEFPGAKGAFLKDPDIFHSGRASFRLDADFEHGGAYVGCFRSLANAPADVKELHFWVRSVNVGSIGIRLIDSTDQCHQLNGGIEIAAVPAKQWQEIVVRPLELVGGEHWGGANDGKWHPPLKGFGINVGVHSLIKDTVHHGSIWIDDAYYLPAAKP